MKLARTNITHYLFTRYPNLLKAVALCDNQARPIALAGDIDEDVLKNLVGYQLAGAEILGWTLKSNWQNFQQGQILLLKLESDYLFLMAYPSCQQKQLKEIIDCLGNKHSFQDKPLSHCDRQFLERCQGQLKKYVGPLAFVLLERAMKFYRSDNRTIFLEEIAVQVSSHTKSQALAQAFYCEILSLDDEKTND